MKNRIICVLCASAVKKVFIRLNCYQYSIIPNPRS
jgi:hypothetical protein